MAFNFGNIKTTSKKGSSSLKELDNVILLDKTKVRSTYNRPIAILLDRNYSDEEMTIIDNFFKTNGINKSIYVSSVKVDMNTDDAKVERDKLGVTKFYRKYRSNIEDVIPDKCNIITSGPALYSLLMEDDIYPNHVQQCIFGKTFFTFSKDLTNKNNHRVFPIESLDDLFPIVSEKINFWKSKKPCDSYKTKLAKNQITKAIELTDTDPHIIDDLTKVRIRSSKDFDELFYEPNKDKHEYVAWDLETSGFNFMTDKIGCITLSFDGNTGYYIPWKILDYEHLLKLNEILGNNKQILANGKFDIKFLWKNGVPDAHIDEDVIIIGHTLDETRANSLKALAFYYTEYGGYERPLDDYKDRVKIETYLDIPEDILYDYATMDAIVTYRVWERIIKHMKSLDVKYQEKLKDEISNSNDKVKPATVNMTEYYYKRRLPAVNMYAKLEYEGLYINKEKLDSLRKEMIKFIEDKQYELFNDLKVDKVWPEEGWRDLKGNGHFDWESSKKLGTLLVTKCGWEELGKTDSGDIQVSDYQLDRWVKTHPEAEKISLIKSVSTLLNGFVGDDRGTKGWPQYMIQHDDGSWRIHANYQAMFTDSGRTKCKNPNFQNIPTRGKYSKEIKGCICSPDDENYYIATLDYSSLQMRLACIDCADENLSSAFFVPGVDVHSKTAYLSFFADKEIDVEIVDVEQDGKKYHFLGGEVVLTQRGEILAKDLKEDDEIKE